MVIPAIFFVGIMIGAFGGILMKVGATAIGSPNITSVGGVLQFLLHLATNVPMMSGMALYFLSAIIWSYLLTKLEISFVQPILALTYVATPILAMLLLHENVTALRWAGIIVIIVGVFIVARS